MSAEKDPAQDTKLSPDLLVGLQARKSGILSATAALLASDRVKDPTDSRLIAEAAAFIENPTESLEGIKAHTTNIGMVISGYEQLGEDFPPEVNDMHAYLFALQCINRIDFVEKKRKEQGSPDSQEIQEAIAQALDWATVLSRGYKDDTLLSAVNELKASGR